MSKKKDKFNEFRFAGLNPKKESNQYLTMDRCSEDNKKIVVKVADSHLIETRYGYALILDYAHVAFLKDWQVDRNWYGNEVLLDKEFWKPKEWGEHPDFGDIPENLFFENWLAVAKKQILPVKWQYKD